MKNNEKTMIFHCFFIFPGGKKNVGPEVTVTALPHPMINRRRSNLSENASQNEPSARPQTVRERLQPLSWPHWPPHGSLGIPGIPWEHLGSHLVFLGNPLETPWEPFGAPW